MKRPAIALLSAVLLLGFPAFAQEPTDTEKKSTVDPTGQLHTFHGTVKQYEAGKQLILMTSDKKTKTFKLDQEGLTVNVDPAIAVGAQVKVTVQKSGDGTKSLTVAPISRS